jgi:hypothetical protein
MANASQRKIRSLSPFAMTCRKCGTEYDPRVQSSACHAKVRHYPITQVSTWQPPPAVPADKLPKQPAAFQGDFRSLWDEIQPRAPK